MAYLAQKHLLLFFLLLYGGFSFCQIKTTTKPSEKEKTQAPSKKVAKEKESTATEQETKDWLLEKFNTYTSDTKNYTDYSFSIEDCYFIVKCYKFNSVWVLQKIPLWGSFEIILGTDGLFFKANNGTLMYENTLGLNAKIIKSENIKYSAFMGLDITREENLEIRINKAFKHLKKFCQKPAGNQPF